MKDTPANSNEEQTAFAPMSGAPASDAIITVRNLTVRFGERTIFQNVSYDVPRGKIFVILGGSGCGKSTMLRALTGLVEPQQGEIMYNCALHTHHAPQHASHEAAQQTGSNKSLAASFTTSFNAAHGTASGDLVTSVGEERLKLLKNFGILFQSGGLFASMTLAENIALPLTTDAKTAGFSQERLSDIVAMKLGAVGLSGFEAFLPSEISGGMKKRAGIARAMALDPPILFFDEPSAGLDPISSAALDNLIRELNAALGTTMVVVTHELQSIEEIADYVIMLDRSAQGIIAEGTLAEVKSSTDKRVTNFFNRVSES
jgi:phospholipid/cholesterol/gamma-HCH transport system ATP-binding protein